VSRRYAAEAEVERLRAALDEIRQAATLHYVGGAFDPMHMRAIANFAIGTLDGEDAPDLDDQPPPVLVEELNESCAAVQRVRALCEAARPGLSLPPPDCTNACAYGDCTCSGKRRVTEWTLDPAAVLAALDGEQP
jgi:hypothetical protein